MMSRGVWELWNLFLFFSNKNTFFQAVKLMLFIILDDIKAKFQSEGRVDAIRIVDAAMMLKFF